MCQSYSLLNGANTFCNTFWLVQNVSKQGHCVSGMIHLGDQRSQNIRTGEHRSGTSRHPTIQSECHKKRNYVESVLCQSLCDKDALPKGLKAVFFAFSPNTHKLFQRPLRIRGNTFSMVPSFAYMLSTSSPYTSKVLSAYPLSTLIFFPHFQRKVCY